MTPKQHYTHPAWECVDPDICDFVPITLCGLFINKLKKDTVVWHPKSDYRTFPYDESECDICILLSFQPYILCKL